jgi:Outer membrane protein beta-barrel domain
LQKKLFILYPILFWCIATHAQQPQFSLATGLDVQRNFKKQQQYWAAGHNTVANFHITPQNGVYVSFSYYSDGKVSNQLTATAKLPATIPQQLSYENKSRIRFKQFSIGWKRYLKGKPDAESSWNMYGLAGFGLMLGRVTNTHSISVDTANYSMPVLSGKANFKRLTFDLGLGAEYPLGGDFYLYGEGKVFIPTTDYPSNYLFINDKAPFTAILGVGIRLLF